MRWGLRYQLLVAPVILVLAVAGITTWTAVAAAQRARESLERRMRAVVEMLSQPHGFELSEAVLEKMQSLSGAGFVRVRDDGAMAGTLRVDAASLPPARVDYGDLQTLRLDSHVEVEGRAYLCSGIRLLPPRQDDRLYIFYPEQLWMDARWEAIRPSLIVGGLLGLAAVAVALAAGHRLTRRIQELERRTRQIAAGDFSPMPLPRRNDELRDLGQSVNEMAQRLAQLQETVQRTERLRLLGQVGSGLAHQLRNGVAGARLAIQLHLREGLTVQDPSALNVALRQLTLVESNLKQFLNLGNDSPTVRSVCAVPALLVEAVNLVEPQARHAGIKLTCTPGNSDALVLGDASQLEQMFLNLLTNAVQAAGPHGFVTVACVVVSPDNDPHERSAGERRLVVVDIEDSGPGPPTALVDRLFEPFVTGKPEGIGLGLAVARQAAAAHEGTLTWCRVDGRTRFRVQLPAIDNTPDGRDATGAVAVL